MTSPTPDVVELFARLDRLIVDLRGDRASKTPAMEEARAALREIAKVWPGHPVIDERIKTPYLEDKLIFDYSNRHAILKALGEGE